MEHNYQKSPSLTLGTTYLSQDGFPVIPIKALPGTRALFVTEEFYPTPFVVWTYGLTSTNEIILYSGTYYPTLEEALIKEV
jgi:hypothetical protein